MLFGHLGDFTLCFLGTCLVESGPQCFLVPKLETDVCWTDKERVMDNGRGKW